LQRFVAVIVNRRARHLAANDAPALVAIRTAARGAKLFETASLAELDDAARAAASEGAHAVLLAGGDGSYMAGVTAIARAFGDRALPEIALAPGGTVSTVARDVGVRGPRARSAARVVRAAIEASGSAVRQPTLRVNESIGFIFGAGLVASFFDAYYAAPRQGYAGAARIVARIFASSFVGGALARKILEPQPCTLLVDGEARPSAAYSLIAASVVRDLGLHMLLTYRAGVAEDRFHVVASPLGPKALGPQMPLVLAGRKLLGRDHTDALAREIVVRFPNEASYVLDGELLRAREVRVTPGPVLTLRIP
jgi:diacylglycerol kinase family enzyme